MPDATQLREGLRGGNVRVLAKAISLAEDDPAAGERLAAQLGDLEAQVLVLGITGATGVGKSTLIRGLIERALQDGRRTGVLAVDPSSPLSGGALLGDRFRMSFPEADPSKLFIRSLSSRGNNGGISRGLGAGVEFLKHAGYEVILVETTGAGQCEFDVVRMVDVVCLLLAEGYGDELQAMKSGLMEIADVLVINKCRRPGTDRLRRDLESQLTQSSRFVQFGLLPPPILLTDGLSGEGMKELWQQLRTLSEDAAHREARARKRQHLTRYSAVSAVLDQLRDRLLSRLREFPIDGGSHEAIEQQIRETLAEMRREEPRMDAITRGSEDPGCQSP